MADPDGPRKLWQRRDLSPDLTRALCALRTGPDDSARLARVAGGLGALLDQGHEPTSRIIRRAELQGRRSSLRPWLAGGLALLAPIVWLARGGWPLGPEPAPLSAASTGLPVPAASAPAPAASAGSLLLETAEVPGRSVQLSVGAHDVAPGRAHAKPRARPPLRAAQSSARRAGVAAQSSRVADAERSASADDTAAQLKAAETPAPPAPPPAAEVATAPVAEVASEPEPSGAAELPAPRLVSSAAESGSSESDLLLTARAALRANPERALSLVAEHEARFPRGALVPEREVLAIEVLRSLGRQAAAKERLARFAARYPHSFYLEGLQR